MCVLNNEMWYDKFDNGSRAINMVRVSEKLAWVIPLWELITDAVEHIINRKWLRKRPIDEEEFSELKPKKSYSTNAKAML